MLYLVDITQEDRPVSRASIAQQACCSLFGSERVRLETENPEAGVWKVELPTRLENELLAAKRIELARYGFRIVVVLWDKHVSR